MDMKKILQNMDSAVAGEKPAAPAEVGSMKAILESLHDVSDKEVVNEAATITVSAETGAEVADMIAALQANAGMKPTAKDMPIGISFAVGFIPALACNAAIISATSAPVSALTVIVAASLTTSLSDTSCSDSSIAFILPTSAGAAGFSPATAESIFCNIFFISIF